MNIRPIIRRVSLLTRGVINSFLFTALKKGRFNPERSMMIVGSTRSGSTWLSEIVTAVGGNVQIFEPMNAKYVPDARRYEIVPDIYRDPGEKWEAGERFFHKVLSGGVSGPWVLSQSTWREVLFSKRLVVKVVRGTMLTGWLSEQVTTLPPALALRHPCAIIASQLNKGWPVGKGKLLNHDYMKRLPNIREQCEGLSEPEELLAMAWCLRYHAALSVPKPYPFILICYERLVRRGTDELEPLFQAWELEMDDVVRYRVNRPSGTVTDSSSIVKGEDPLAGWKTKLSDSQVANILNVLKIFGMDFYSRDLEPDYGKLAAFGAVRSE